MRSIDHILAEVERDIVATERRLETLRGRERVLREWMSEDAQAGNPPVDLDAESGEKPQRAGPSAATPAPLAPAITRVGYAVAHQGPPLKPVHAVRTHTMSDASPPGAPVEDDEEPDHTLTAQIMRILSASPRSMTCKEIFETGKFDKMESVAATLNAMTLKKQTLYRNSKPGPGGRNLFFYRIRAGVTA